MLRSSLIALRECKYIEIVKDMSVYIVWVKYLCTRVNEIRVFSQIFYKLLSWNAHSNCEVKFGIQLIDFHNFQIFYINLDEIQRRLDVFTLGLNVILITILLTAPVPPEPKPKCTTSPCVYWRNWTNSNNIYL